MTNKNKLIVALGFGIGGAIWGLEAYRGTVGSDEVFTNPFSYILGAVAMAVCGGIALVYIENKRLNQRLSRLFLSGKTTKIVGLGLVGWIVAFMVPAVWVEWIMTLGAILIMGLVLLGGIFTLDLVPFITLNPSLLVGHLWFEFLITGAIIGLIYAFLIKAKILKGILYGAGGFALASLLGPILGNIAGNIFGSLFVSYIITFTVIGVVFGKFLAFGIKRPS